MLLAIDQFELAALFENIENIKEFILSFGVLGGFVFALAFALLRPLGFPNVLLALLAVSTWSIVPAFIYSWLGQLGAQLINFLVARYFLHDFIRERLAPRWQHFDEKVERNSFSLVLTGQLLFSRSRTVGWVFGLSKVKMKSFMAASVLGVIPWLLIYLFFVDYFIKVYNEGLSMEELLALGLVVVIVMGLAYRWRYVLLGMLRKPNAKEL